MQNSLPVGQFLILTPITQPFVMPSKWFTPDGKPLTSSRSNRRVYTLEESAELQTRDSVRKRLAWLKEHRGGGIIGTVRNLWSSTLGSARRISLGKIYRINPGDGRFHRQAALALYGVTRKEAKALQAAIEHGVLQGLSFRDKHTLLFQVRTHLFRIFPKRATLALNEQQKRELLAKAIEPGASASEEQKNAFMLLKASFPNVTEIIKNTQSESSVSLSKEAGEKKVAGMNVTIDMQHPAAPMESVISNGQEKSDPVVAELVKSINQFTEHLNGKPYIKTELTKFIGLFDGLTLWSEVKSLQKYMTTDKQGKITGISSALTREQALLHAQNALDVINGCLKKHGIQVTEKNVSAPRSLNVNLKITGSTYAESITAQQKEALGTLVLAQHRLESILQEAAKK